jgi:hypothetical protein
MNDGSGGQLRTTGNGRDRENAVEPDSGPWRRDGATLTLMEAEIALRQVLNRWPELKLGAFSLPRWTGNPVYRGLHALPVHTP